MNSFWQKMVWGNTIASYAFVIGGILVAWFIIRLLRRKVLKQLQVWISKTNTQFDDIIFSATEKFVLPWLYLFINYQLLRQLTLSNRIEKVLHVAMAVVTMYYFIRIVNHALHLAITGMMRRRNESEYRMKQLNGALLVLKALVWLIGIIFLVDNLGYNVTTMIAGLGVGGIAIALAAQTVLGDLFSYFVIFFDKPFEIGDAIVMGTQSGTIEYIGIKTTRIRSVNGEQLIIPNTDLTKLTIQNFKRLDKRRELFTIKVTYQTSSEQLLQIPGLIENIIRSKEKTEFDRAHLAAYGDFSINYEVVYFVLTQDYREYMDIRQAVLHDLFERFREHGIEFAYPTQTLYYKTSQATK